MASSILDQFSVTSVEGLEEGKEKGRGCYGAVYEVRLHGSPCIAKRLHGILVGNGDVLVSKTERRAVIDRFREECVLLSGLRHPNVVQFMGVYYGRDEADINLIMEYVHMDLDQCMKTYPDIPLPYKTSILRDVAYGLTYLHSIPIIHRDLNAGNVLLTESLRAKIADLGVAKLFDMDTLMHRTKSPCPGAYDFMPPESFEKKPKYDAKLDNFSFGHLILYLANQQFPRVVDSAVTPKDVKKKQMQVAKRREALNQMGTKHPLHSIAVLCLSDSPSQRPASRDLVKKMEELCEKEPLPHKNIIAMTKELSDLRNHAEQMTSKLEEKSERLEIELQATRSLRQDKDDVIEQLQIKTKKIDELTEIIHKKEAIHADLTAQFNSLQRLHTSEMELQKEVTETLNIKQCRVDELEEWITVAETKAETYKNDFLEERADRERKHSELYEIKEKSAVTIKQLEKRLNACQRELEERRKGQQRTHAAAQRDQQRTRSVVEASSIEQKAIQKSGRRQLLTLTSASKPTSDTDQAMILLEDHEDK